MASQQQSSATAAGLSIDEKTLNSLFEQSKFSEEQKKLYQQTLYAQMRADNHDIALDEKLEIIRTCFEHNVQSVIGQVPDIEEGQLFRQCLRKFARTKMRCVSYYHQNLHLEQANDATYLHKNLEMMMPMLHKYHEEAESKQ